MRIGLVVETLTHLALALVRTPWLALPVFFVFGAHAFVWGSTSITVRQRAVPQALQGRVTAVNTVGTFGGLALGSGVGGVLAQQHGVTAPFWFAFAGSAVFVALVWRSLRHVAHADEEADARRPRERAPGGPSAERLREVGDEVVGVLDADGQAHEVVRHLQQRPGDGGVRHLPGCSTRDSTPPRDSPRVKSSVAPQTVSASSTEASRKLIIPPKRFICRDATSWLRCSARPG